MKALVISDPQVDFVEGGRLAVAGGQAVLEKIDRLIRGGDHDVIVITQDWHVNPGPHFSLTPDFKDSWPHHCVAGTRGAEIVDCIDEAVCWERRPYAVFRKGQYAASYSGFDGASNEGVSLDIWLRAHGVDSVDIVGLAFDHCVLSTSIDAAGYGFKTRVHKLFTASVDPSRDAAVIAELEHNGVRVVA